MAIMQKKFYPINLCRIRLYIHLNPVRAGLVENLQLRLFSASNYVNASGMLKIEKSRQPIIDVLDSNTFVKYKSTMRANFSLETMTFILSVIFKLAPKSGDF
jgi:hypothetical protein